MRVGIRADKRRIRDKGATCTKVAEAGYEAIDFGNKVLEADDDIFDLGSREQ